MLIVRIWHSTFPMIQDDYPPVVSRLILNSYCNKVQNCVDLASSLPSSVRIVCKQMFLTDIWIRKKVMMEIGGCLLGVQNSHSLRVFASIIIKIYVNPRIEVWSINIKSICNNCPGYY